MPPPAGHRLGRNVIALGIVSLLTDLSSEMIYPLLPLFLSATLGAGAGVVGAIEGAAESTAALLKLASGWWSDRVRRRKPLVVAGYALAAIARPLVGLAASPLHVLLVRLTDRVGKGIRTAPRDALIADSVHPSIRGRAYGFHRSADHLGAVFGPLVAFAALQWAGLPLRTVFLLAAIPGALAVAVLVLGVRERAGVDAGDAPVGGGAARAGDTVVRAALVPPASAMLPVGRGAPPEDQVQSETVIVHHLESADRSEPLPGASMGAGGPPNEQSAAAASDPRNHPGASGTEPPHALGRRFWLVLAAVLLFTLGNSTDAFLLLRAAELGVPVALVPILWAMLHVVKSASSTPGGALSDRVGRIPLIVAGWTLFALVYLGFGLAREAWHAWALFALYGVYFGLVEGAEKALIADLVPVARRGTAFGWFNLAIGLGALPASLLFGIIWDRAGATAAFVTGAALALAASAWLMIGGRSTLPS